MNNKLLAVSAVLVVLTGLAIFLRPKITSLFFTKVIEPTPSPTTISLPTPSPAPALIRAEWTLEVLNGSEISGLAKKVADQIKALGYQVVKVGNADKSNYQSSQIIVKKEVLDKIDLVIADLKDIVKIATVSADLQIATASARIILGKDSQP